MRKGRLRYGLIENIVECKDLADNPEIITAVRLIENIVECKYIICINSVFMPAHARNTILTHK